MNDLLIRIRAALRRLSPRERLLITTSGGLLAVAILYLGVMQPILTARNNARERALSSEQQVAVMARLRQEFDGIRNGLSSVEQRISQGPKGNIFTILENLARSSAVKVDSMDPQSPLTSDRYRETKVQVVLKGVSLSQTVAYLQRIEAADQVLSVKSLRLRTRSDAPELLDVTFTVSSFEPV